MAVQTSRRVSRLAAHLERRSCLIDATHPSPLPSLAGPATGARSIVAGVTLSVVAIGTFLLMPHLLEAAVGDLHFSEREVGVISACNLGGTTLAAVAASLWVRRCSWRLAAALALLGLLSANIGSMLCHEFREFALLQGMVGLCGGSLYSLSLTVLSDARHPDRAFAYAVGAQTAYQVLGLIAGPFLIHHGGIVAILGLFASLSFIGALFVAWLPAQGRISGVAVGHGRLISAPVLVALAGCFFFYVNINCYWTYIERMGTVAGLSLDAISNSLAFSAVASMAAVVLAAWLGDRMGSLLPIAASAAATIVAVLMLAGTLHLAAYAVSAIIYGNAWNLSMTYQYSTVNSVDPSRRGVALAPAFHNAGGAAGPAIAALFVTEHDHASVIWIVCVSVVVSLVCFAMARALHTAACSDPT